MSIIEKIAAPNGYTLYRVRSDLDLGAVGAEYSTHTIARRAVEKAWAELALDTYRKACEVRVLLARLDSDEMDELIDEDDLRALIAARTAEITAAIWRLGIEGAASNRGTVNEGLADLVDQADKAYGAAENASDNVPTRSAVASTEVCQ